MSQDHSSIFLIFELRSAVLVHFDVKVDIYSRDEFIPSLLISIVDILESRDLERFHSIEKSQVSNPHYRYCR